MATGTALKGYKIPSGVASVSDIQKSLNNDYGAKLKVDNVWGPQTDAAWNTALNSQTATPKLPANTSVSSAVQAPASTVGSVVPGGTTLPVLPATAPDTFAANPQIGTLQDNLLNFKINPFDPNTSQEYASYKQQYDAKGNQAYQEGLGNMAAASGGRVSSYAGAVAQQGKQSWDTQLMNVIPTLAAADRARQSENYNMMANQLTMLQNADNTAYTRQRNTVADAAAVQDKKLAADLSTLGQYSANYQKKINELTNDGDPSNDYLIQYLQSARQDKITTQKAATVKANTDATALARKTLVEDRTYALDKINTNSLAASRGATTAASSKDISSKGTPAQVAEYYNQLNTFLTGQTMQTGGADAVSNAALANKGNLVKILGPQLADQLLADLKGNASTVAQPGAPAPIPEISDVKGVSDDFNSAPDKYAWYTQYYGSLTKEEKTVIDKLYGAYRSANAKPGSGYIIIN